MNTIVTYYRMKELFLELKENSYLDCDAEELTSQYKQRFESKPEEHDEYCTIARLVISKVNGENQSDNSQFLSAREAEKFYTIVPELSCSFPVTTTDRARQLINEKDGEVITLQQFWDWMNEKFHINTIMNPIENVHGGSISADVI